MEPDIREKAHQICGDYLGGIWKIIPAKELVIEKLSGGFLNYIVKISLPKTQMPVANEPREVVMRNFLEQIPRGEFAKMKENIVNILMAENQLAPKVYGVFDGGRLDEYISSRVLKPHDLYDENLLKCIVKKMARIHALNLPFSKEPTEILNMMDNLLKSVLADPRNINADPKRQSLFNKLQSLSPDKEFKWLVKTIKETNSPVVFCHNDFQINNMLLKDHPGEDPIQIIDFEMSGYSFRAMEFACFYQCFSIDTQHSTPPYFKVDWSQYPSEDFQKHIIRIYLEEYQKRSNKKMDIEEDEKRLFQESKIFVLWLNFGVLVYSLWRDENIKSTMDWISFGSEMCDSYNKFKKLYSDMWQPTA